MTESRCTSIGKDSERPTRSLLSIPTPMGLTLALGTIRTVNALLLRMSENDFSQVKEECLVNINDMVLAQSVFHIKIPQIMH